MDNQTKIPNRLINEKSPYLLQHAHNPVDWYPWGEEAFEKAREENKPIFLSIGYSTCHWCHVMERESFEDKEVAELLNLDFISIKVDREERPDVDSVYMGVCQALTGGGGWPLTIFMTPEQKPFYATTYLPKYSRQGIPGMMTTLVQIENQWEQDQDRIKKSAEEISAYIKGQQEGKGKASPTSTMNAQEIEALLHRGAKQLEQDFDEEWGGFGTAPKFPIPHNLLFLLFVYVDSQENRIKESLLDEKTENPRLLAIVEKTLVQMYRGGIFDHVGGGFSRYSTDEFWLAPHFEKMLYDNALLALAYLEAFRVTGRELYREVAEKTLGYMERELTHEQGGFFCGQDADSEGEEGKYYVFTPAEVEKVLGEEAGREFCKWFGIEKAGNFEGKSIPNLIQNLDYDNPPPVIENYCELIFEYRKTRTKLHKDDKILTSWNGLSIWAFAKASQVTGKPEHLKTAQKAASFLQSNLMGEDGRLKIRWREGEPANEGQLDDYAFFGLSLLELYQADFDFSWLRTATKLGEVLLELFEDKEKGGFFMYGSHVPALISRPKESYDGAMPSGNSMAGMFLEKLARLTSDKIWQEAAGRQAAFLAHAIAAYPAGHTMGLLALGQELNPKQYACHGGVCEPME